MRATGFKRLILLLGLSLGLFAGAFGLTGTANAGSSDGRAADLLGNATKAYEAGSYSEASGYIDAAFKSGLTGELAARAILLRAQVNEKSGALANALQDYSNALWMQSLPASERKKATDGKARVMAAIGVSSPSAGSGQASATGGNVASPAASPESSSGIFGFLSGSSQAGTANVTVAAPAAAPENSSGVLGFFDGLFGSGEKKPEVPPSAAQQPVTAAAAEPPVKAAKPIKAAQAAKPAPAQVKTAARKEAAPQAASALSVASSPDGFLIVFGAASSEASGRSAAKTIKTQLSDILIHRELDVTPRPSGGFQVQAGPYKAKSAALALCTAIRQRGVQCQVTP